MSRRVHGGLLSLMIMAALLSGCGGLKGLSAPSFSFMNTYDAALKDFERGRIMEARRKVLAMDKSREDYPQAAKLLKQKIEPARKRLERHYLSQAAASERGGAWYKAMRFYALAAEVSLGKSAAAKLQEMELKMRQERMNSLIAQRRIEDAAILSWDGKYAVPSGVSPRDGAFARMREEYQEMLDDRASLAYREAKSYLGHRMPGVAYVEIESHLRLEPGSEQGKKLRAEIMQAMPKGMYIPKIGSTVRKSSVARRPQPKSVTVEQVRALMRKGKWIEARNYARVYRREGGNNADALLKEVEASIEKRAAMLFEKGSLAFRMERLDEAVSLWQETVALQPDNAEYVESLRRAEQLQERLQLLNKSE